MKGGLVFLVLLSLAAAMVPHSRIQRAVYTDDVATPAPETKEENKPVFCQARTPCEWRIYLPKTDILKDTITNTFCICDKGYSCEFSEEDTTTDTHTYRCRPLPDNTTTEDTESAYS